MRIKLGGRVLRIREGRGRDDACVGVISLCAGWLWWRDILELLGEVVARVVVVPGLLPQVLGLAAVGRLGLLYGPVCLGGQP